MSNKMLNAGALSRAWLAAAAAGVPLKWDKRFDRSLVLEFAPDGVVLVGVSPDLIVACSVPYTQSKGANTLNDAVIESVAGDWPTVMIDDDPKFGGMGTKTMRAMESVASKSPGMVRCSLTAMEDIPAGQMIGRAVVELVVDQVTRGTLIPVGSWSPPGWRDGMPGASEPVIPKTPLMVEAPSASHRLGRIVKHLPDTPTLEWELYVLASGKTIRYLRITDQDGTVEIAQAVSLVAGVVPTIFDVEKPAGMDDGDSPVFDDTPLGLDDDTDPDDDDGDVDDDAANAIAGTFGKD